MTHYDALKLIRHLIDAQTPYNTILDARDSRLNVKKSNLRHARILFRIQAILVKEGINEN